MICKTNGNDAREKKRKQNKTREAHKNEATRERGQNNTQTEPERRNYSNRGTNTNTLKAKVQRKLTYAFQ